MYKLYSHTLHIVLEILYTHYAASEIRPCQLLGEIVMKKKPESNQGQG